jgi:hypothetical protein
MILLDPNSWRLQIVSRRDDLVLRSTRQTDDRMSSTPSIGGGLTKRLFSGPTYPSAYFNKCRVRK